MSNQCNTSSDCYGIFDDTITRFCYEEAVFSDEVFFCDCSPWYGWQGESCDQPSFQLYWFRFMLIIMAIAAIFSIVLLTSVLFSFGKLLYTSRNRRFKKKNSKEGPYFLAALCFWIGSVVVLVNALLQLPSLFDPERFEIISYSFPEFEDVTVINGKFVAYILFITPLTHMTGLLMVLLVWFDILKQSSKYFPDMFGRQETFLEHFLKYSTIFFIVTTVIGLAIDSVFLTISVACFLSFVYGLLFAHTTKRFLSVLSSYLDAEANREIFFRLKRTHKVAMVTTYLAFASLTIFMLLSFVQYEVLSIGKFNFVLFARDITVGCGLYLSIYMGFFLRKASNNIVARTSKEGFNSKS